MPDNSQPRWRTRVAIGVIALLAIGIRLFYVHTAVVFIPIRGDATQYMTYAINMVEHHTFSMQRDDIHPSPDSFRDPGYSTLLALMITIFGRGVSFYVALLNLQALLSGVTVGLCTWMASRVMGLTATVAVGLGLAVWPHLLTSSDYILSETLLGLLVTAAVGLMISALDRSSRLRAAASGIMFACAALTNAVLLPVAPLVGFVGAWRDQERRGLWLLLALCALAPCAAWSVRNATLDPHARADGRATMNFVQGASPEYHTAWKAATINHDPRGRIVLDQIDREYRLTLMDPAKGLATVAARLLDTPRKSLAWYTSKPAELWGWEIGIGSGDIYTFPTLNSPLTGTGLLRFTTDVCYALNRPISLLALAAIILIVARRSPVELVLIAFITVYVTAVFTVLQADARYSVPYRGFEWLLACYAASQGFTWLRDQRRRGVPAGESQTIAQCDGDSNKPKAGASAA
jgi:hypothetical protein